MIHEHEGKNYLAGECDNCGKMSCAFEGAEKDNEAPETYCIDCAED